MPCRGDIHIVCAARIGQTVPHEGVGVGETKVLVATSVKKSNQQAHFLARAPNLSRRPYLSQRQRFSFAKRETAESIDIDRPVRSVAGTETKGFATGVFGRGPWILVPVTARRKCCHDNAKSEAVVRRSGLEALVELLLVVPHVARTENCPAAQANPFDSHQKGRYETPSCSHDFSRVCGRRSR